MATVPYKEVWFLFVQWFSMVTRMMYDICILVRAPGMTKIEYFLSYATKLGTLYSNSAD
jgi:hypothetical protein